MLTGMNALALSRVLPPWQRRALVGALGLVLAIVVFATTHVLTGIGGGGLDAPIRDWASAAVYILVALVVIARAIQVEDSRRPWMVIAVGISLYGAGNLIWSLWLEHVASPPIPSICDVLWLALYPSSYLGIALLARRQWRSISAGVWLDGIVAGLAIAALGAALVFEPVLHSSTGSLLAVSVNLAYPIGDLLLAALVVGVLALRGWHLDRTWALLGAGFLVLTVADSIYLRQVANGLSTSSNQANLFYMAGVGLIALAAWQEPERSELPRTDGVSTLLVPALFALAAVGVLAYDHFARLGMLAFSLCLLTVLVALFRAALAFRDLRLFSEARRQSVTDDLTELPNRRLFHQRLAETIARGGAAHHGMAVLMVDLDHFKELNDTLGHQSGDELLRRIGPRLLNVVRPVDTLARLGGDEFGIVVDGPTNEAGALLVAERIRDALAEPFDVQDISLRVSASVGIALFPAHADTAEELLRRADVAMYDAKRTRSGCEVYEPERDNYSRNRLALAADLERALGNGEITAYFQPKADARTSKIVGMEALARWWHPRHGLLQPANFIPLAEASGLIRALTRHVLDLALAQCAAWRREGFELQVAVNVTVADLLDIALPVEVAAALERHRLPPEALVIEITESSVFSDPVRIRAVLDGLDELGICLSLDDFGTGFSSLGHVKSLPITEIKIDRSFVEDMTTSSADAAIVHTMIELANRLGKRVVAEGVERDETWQQLASAGCHLIQGYILSRPRPALELAALLEEHGLRTAGLQTAQADDRSDDATPSRTPGASSTSRTPGSRNGASVSAAPTTPAPISVSRAPTAAATGAVKA
jgi:diguanylate cyclase